MDRVLKGLILGLIIFNLSGCDDGSDSGSNTAEMFYARFDPANSVIPFPNNLLFSKSQDLTLNIPVADESNYADPAVAMNTLDGFSTSAPFTAQFSSAIDKDSVIAGETVRVFKVSLGVQLEVTGVIEELIAEQDYTAVVAPEDPYGTTLAVLPKRPLAPQTGYLVVLTKGLKGQSGDNASSDLTYAFSKSETALVNEFGASMYDALEDSEAQALEPLRLLTNASEAYVEAFSTTLDTGNSIDDLVRSDIVLSWSFKTQSIGETLNDVISGIQNDTITSGPLAAVSSGASTPAGAASIQVGQLTVPYYLTAASGTNSIEPLAYFWHGEDGGFLLPGTAPAVTGSQNIPVIVTVPSATAPATGWPVVIFQHGIIRNRTDLLAIADGLASAGFAGVAIDLPLHGITTTDASDPLYAFKTDFERTFNLDLMNNADGSAGPDGITDESGRHFINLANLLVTRDNVRQAVVDLAVLRHHLNDLNEAGAAPMVNSDQVYFVGHSLGAIVGTIFLDFVNDPTSTDFVQDAVLAMSGGGIPKLLDGSPSFGPEIAAGLATEGLIKATPDYESYMRAAQTIMDTADPINYAMTHAVTDSRGILMYEIVGGNSSLPDQVIPNNVLSGSSTDTVPSLLAGTDPLARMMGLVLWQGEDPVGVNQKVCMRFNAGHHGSLLTPNDAIGNPDALSEEVYLEMLGQTGRFLVSSGAVSTVNRNLLLSQ